MFTGLIEEIGIIENIVRSSKSGSLKVGCNKVIEGVRLGDSISVNGICLTVIKFDNGSFTVDFMPETLRATNLGLLVRGSRVNLERALMVGDRLGGHIVSGHIDGTGKITELKERENATEVWIDADNTLLKYIIKKGSIAIDGASLTVADLSRTGFMVSIIPHTSKETTLLDKKPGALVNLECDSLGKYIERLMEFKVTAGSKLTVDFLNRNGFL
ncbi:MAG: riboflavin synthase [Fusobacteria bacterium]|nr:MAG: riboflavin synthase [Fusobacteriota bacterium]KAF0230176.1 MAG: riboflavin [Fusobacteriota bacterium]